MAEPSYRPKGEAGRDKHVRLDQRATDKRGGEMNIEIRKIDDKYVNVIVNIDSTTKFDLGLMDADERLAFIQHLSNVIHDLCHE